MRFLVLASLAAVASCASIPRTPVSDVDVLVERMSGSFASTAQAASDKDYLDIRLEMAPIWTSRTDGRWLYVEQARADRLDKPYRQRVYRVHEGAQGLVSDVYTLPGNALDWAGAWKEPKRFDALDPARLEAREGCSIYLERRGGGAFAGSTRDRACPSELQGASYATSEVVITESMLESWDRGFDGDGKQVWGAVKGAYQFVKQR